MADHQGTRHRDGRRRAAHRHGHEAHGDTGLGEHQAGVEGTGIATQWRDRSEERADRRLASKSVLAARHSQSHAHGSVRQSGFDDGDRLHVFARVGESEVQLVQPPPLDRPVEGADRRPAEVDLRHAVDHVSDGGHVLRYGVALLAALKVIDLDTATVRRHERPPAGHESHSHPGSQRDRLGRQRDETLYELRWEPDDDALDQRACSRQRRPRPLRGNGDPHPLQHLEGGSVQPSHLLGREHCEATRSAHRVGLWQRHRRYPTARGERPHGERPRLAEVGLPSTMTR